MVLLSCTERLSCHFALHQRLVVLSIATTIPSSLRFRLEQRVQIQSRLRMPLRSDEAETVDTLQDR